MNNEKFTIKTQEALNEAMMIAQKNDHSQIESEHLLLALLRQENGIIPPVIKQIGVDINRLSDDVEALVKGTPKIFGEAAQVFVSSALSKVLAKAEVEASALKDEFVSTEHILIAMAAGEGRAADILKKAGVNKNAILGALKQVRGKTRVTDQNPEEKYQALDRYCRDLTALARQEKLDPVIG
ncbi:MAG: type VI secretion system ATPase TssH, partial [Treponema sp.]|nr:type VI secretion system ATPase TssH [Treponema sp.]